MNFYRCVNPHDWFLIKVKIFISLLYPSTQFTHGHRDMCRWLILPVPQFGGMSNYLLFWCLPTFILHNIVELF